LRTEPLPTEPRATAWWEAPALLALVGALAIHLIIATAGDVLVVLNPPRPAPPRAPAVELFEVEVPPVLAPPPPPVVTPAPQPPAVAAPRVASHAPTRSSEPPAPPAPAPPTPAPPEVTTPEGGGPVVAMPDVAPGATGVAVARGAVQPGHVGRGGAGTGTGTGTGSGTGDAPMPMSVATIKTRALPRSDYAHEEIKDFPAEARRLGIEGKIRVKLIVDAHGVVKSAVLLDRLGAGLDELALAKAKVILFDPAKDTDDRPVASVVVWTFDMVAPK
jgi:TonB family protein